MKGRKTNRDEGEYEYCGYMGKRMFNTKGEAERAVREVKRKRKGDMSVYQCKYCGSWHTTSMSYQRSKDLRQGRVTSAGELFEM